MSDDPGTAYLDFLKSLPHGDPAGVIRVAMDFSVACAYHAERDPSRNRRSAWSGYSTLAVAIAAGAVAAVPSALPHQGEVTT